MQKSQINCSEEADDKDKRKHIQCYSILQRSIDEVRVRDALLDIANYCDNFSLFEIIPNQKTIKTILKHATPQIAKLLRTCFVETKSSRKIVTLPLPSNMEKKFIIFRKNSCIVSLDECTKEILYQ